MGLLTLIELMNALRVAQPILQTWTFLMFCSLQTFLGKRESYI